MSDQIDLKKICTKIIGIGKNYKSSPEEADNPPGHPLIFSKFPETCLITEGPIKLPHGFDQILHEVELGVVMGRTGKHIKEEEAMDYVLGYVLALDMTTNLELDKYPIMLLKSFDTSCPISHFIPKSLVPDINNLDLKLSVNGVVRHDGNTRDLLRKVPYLISYLSKYFTLGYGDLILSGTPAGAGAVKDGDEIEASLADLAHIKFKVSK